jgi:hypothetical protein
MDECPEGAGMAGTGDTTDSAAGRKARVGVGEAGSTLLA